MQGFTLLACFFHMSHKSPSTSCPYLKSLTWLLQQANLHVKILFTQATCVTMLLTLSFYLLFTYFSLERNLCLPLIHMVETQISL